MYFFTYKIYKIIIIIQDLKKPLDLKKFSNSQISIIRFSWAYQTMVSKTADKRGPRTSGATNIGMAAIHISTSWAHQVSASKNRGQTRSTDNRGADNRGPTSL